MVLSAIAKDIVRKDGYVHIFEVLLRIVTHMLQTMTSKELDGRRIGLILSDKVQFMFDI